MLTEEPELNLLLVQYFSGTCSSSEASLLLTHGTPIPQRSWSYQYHSSAAFQTVSYTLRFKYALR
jgi:hypothetical protein